MAYSGSQLKKVRLERNIPLEQIASATRIRLAILQDLEDEEYSELSSTTQTKGFLRLYAEVLGLPESLLEDDQILDTAPSQELISIPEESSPPASTPPSLSPEPLPPAVEAITLPPVEQPLPQLSSEPRQTSELESQKDLESIGRELAARRRYLNISWDVIEEETHIPKDQLRSVERGDLDSFVNPMQYKGLLQSYTRFLNLDLEGVMLRYAEAIQKRRVEKSQTKRKRLTPFKVLPPVVVNLRRFFTLDLFFGTLIILGIVGFLIWGISRMSFAEDSPEITGTLPAVADVLLSEATEQMVVTEQVTDEPGEAVMLVPTATPFYTSSDQASPVELVILTRQNTWLRVLSDGEILYQGRQAAGNVLTYAADEEIELQTGNIAGIEIIYNQDPYDNTEREIGSPARLLFSSFGVSELPLFDLEPTAEP